jgi:hypothetical protein
MNFISRLFERGKRSWTSICRRIAFGQASAHINHAVQELNLVIKKEQNLDGRGGGRGGESNTPCSVGRVFWKRQTGRDIAFLGS